MRGRKYLDWERERKVLLRDGRGIGEIGEKVGEKMGGKTSEKMGGKMGEERCEGEREAAQVSSSVGVVVNVITVVTDSGPLAWGGDTFRPLVKS
jgi:hypothetical protein